MTVPVQVVFNDERIAAFVARGLKFRGIVRHPVSKRLGVEFLATPEFKAAMAKFDALPVPVGLYKSTLDTWRDIVSARIPPDVAYLQALAPAQKMQEGS